MTQISPFGIGAGRMASATSDDEDSRARQRRLAASRSSEQARKGVVMQEQLAQAERTALLAEARQRQQQEHADTLRRERQAGSSSKTFDSQLPLASGSGSRPSLPPPARAGDSLPEPPEERPLHQDENLPPLHTSRTPTQPQAPRPSEAPHLLISRLIDALPQWRAHPFAGDMEKRLEPLQQAIAEARSAPAPDSREALEALVGSLDFVQGYLEASPLADDSLQQLVMIIDGMRQEVTIMMSAGAGPLTGMAPTASALANAGNEVLPVKGSIAGHRVRKGEDVDLAGASGKDPEDEAGAPSFAGTVPLAMAPASTEPLRSAVPSLERDVDKRKSETPVSVAVRSI